MVSPDHLQPPLLDQPADIRNRQLALLCAFCFNCGLAKVKYEHPKPAAKTGNWIPRPFLGQEPLIFQFAYDRRHRRGTEVHSPALTNRRSTVALSILAAEQPGSQAAKTAAALVY